MVGQEMTIVKLKEKLDKVVAAGYGDMQITLNDDVLHEDEVSFDFLGKRMRIRGMIYNSKDYERIAELRRDMEKAWEKFMARS